MKKIKIFLTCVLLCMICVGLCVSRPTVKTSKKTLTVGQTATVTFKPNGLKKSKWSKCKWSSSNKKVVKITTKKTKGKKKVKIKAVKSGKAYIRVKCNKKTYKVKITVKSKGTSSDKTKTDSKTDSSTDSSTDNKTTEKSDSTTEDVTNVNPENLIGKLSVSYGWYYDVEGKNKITGPLTIDKDHTSFTVYEIIKYTINGKPVPLNMLKQVGLCDDGKIVAGWKHKDFVTTLCDGKTEKELDQNDFWDYYDLYDQYCKDGQVVHKFTVFNDLDKKVGTLNFDVYACMPKNTFIGVVSHVASFDISPECRNSTITRIDTYTTDYSREGLVDAVKNLYTSKYRKVTTTEDIQQLTYSITHYQYCKKVASNITYCKIGEYIYQDDLSKYNLGLYYRFNDMCDNCKQNLICSEEQKKYVQSIKQNLIENDYLPLCYSKWNGSVYEKAYYTGKNCTGYTIINTTNGINSPRIVYRHPLGDEKYENGEPSNLKYYPTL